MIDQVIELKEALAISNKSLAQDLDISTSLLSLVLRRQRPISKQLSRKLALWMQIYRGSGVAKHPNSVLQQFIEERKSFVAPGTIISYKQKLIPFVEWCSDRSINNVLMVGRAEISSFINYIRQGKARNQRKVLNESSVKLNHQILKTYFNYVGEIFTVPPNWENPTLSIKVKAKDAGRVEFSDYELNRILELIESNRDGFIRLRNLAMIRTLLASGARASELMAMKASDVDSYGKFRIIGKGGKSRVSTVGLHGLEAIQQYLRVRSSESNMLWVKSDGSPLLKPSLTQIFKNLKSLDSSSFPNGLFPHRFRHTTITRLLRKGIPLRAVQIYAGHSDPTTTLRYARAIDSDQAIDAIDSITTLQ